MTRLDATSEPSMEDILASIRKIIAEDPPGTRAAPAPAANLGRPMAQSVSEPASARGSTRDTFFPVALEPAAAPVAPAPEPYLRAEPLKPSPAGFDSDGFFAKQPSKPFIPEAPSARIEPSFAPMSQPFGTAEAPAPALSVDAQLSDLLGDALPTSAATAAPSSSPLPDATAPAASSRYSETASTRPAPQPFVEQAGYGDVRTEPRQGFTVSRDGFVPGQVAVEPAAERDPFDFDLGPSPFEAKPIAAQTIPASDAAQPSGAQRSTSFDLGGIVPARADETPTGAHPEVPTGPMRETATPKPDATASAKAPIVSAAPSVAATIAPDAVAPPRAAEPVARFVPANASVEAPKTVERDVMEVVSIERPFKDSAQAQTVDACADTTAIAASAGVPATQVSETHFTDSQTGASQRTMEDTVADLLRPMLRTWLAENMPRIVERALQREITEQLGGDKQEAAE